MQTIGYIAYTFQTGKEVQSEAHTTRQGAANELFVKFPKLKNCETAEAVLVGDTWKTFGKNIQPMLRA